MTARPDWRRLLVYTHRWLGIAGGLLFLAWFVSGIVLMYVGMPELSDTDRLARQPPLDLSAARLAPAEAAAVVGARPGRVVIGMLDDRPVYRFPHAGRWTTVRADSGEVIGGLDRTAALAAARRFASDGAPAARYERRLTGPDQWTIQHGAFQPLHRVALGDRAGTRVYVSDRTGDPVLTTTASGRRWAYVGAVLHWLYFTPLRRHTGVWIQLVIWLSIVGCVVTLSGLAWGVWRLSPRRRYRLRREGRSPTPYSGWMKWHHYAGLLFGFVTFTWILSGGLSLEPFNWHPGTAPTPEQQAAVTGAPFQLEVVRVDALRRAVAAVGETFAPREVELVQFRGRVFVRALDPAGDGQRLVSAVTPEHGAFARFDEGAVLQAAHRAMPATAVVEAVWLDAYDAYYYDRRGRRPLPVLRVRYDDPQRTWLYLDPFLGAITRKEERLTRLNRWLYHGLHSLDFPFLYYRRPLWDIVVIALSAGGIALSVTTLAPSWRRLRRHGRRLTGRRAPARAAPGRD